MIEDSNLKYNEACEFSIIYMDTVTYSFKLGQSEVQDSLLREINHFRLPLYSPLQCEPCPTNSKLII